MPTLAPDLDLIGETMKIATYFAKEHGERIMADVGIDPRAFQTNATAVAQSMGLPEGTVKFTARDLQERRELIARRMRHHRAGRQPVGDGAT